MFTSNQLSFVMPVFPINWMEERENSCQKPKDRRVVQSKDGSANRKIDDPPGSFNRRSSSSHKQGRESCRRVEDWG